MAWGPIFIYRVAWTTSWAFPMFPELYECSSRGIKICHRSNLPRSWVDSGEKKDKNTTQLQWLKARNLIMKIGRSLHFSFRKTYFVHFDQITGLIHKQGGDPFNPTMTVPSSGEIKLGLLIKVVYQHVNHNAISTGNWISVQLSSQKESHHLFFKRNLQLP